MTMTVYHQKAIELKYLGYSYPEISKAIGGKLSIQTLRNIFSFNGLLHAEYLRYQNQMQRVTEEEARRELRKTVADDIAILSELQQQAMQSGNLRLAYDIAIKRLSLNGITDFAKTKVDPIESLPMTREEMLEYYNEQGLDPITGLSHRAIEIFYGTKETRQELIDELTKGWPKLRDE